MSVLDDVFKQLAKLGNIGNIDTSYNNPTVVPSGTLSSSGGKPASTPMVADQTQSDQLQLDELTRQRLLDAFKTPSIPSFNVDLNSVNPNLSSTYLAAKMGAGATREEAQAAFDRNRAQILANMEQQTPAIRQAAATNAQRAAEIAASQGRANSTSKVAAQNRAISVGDAQIAGLQTNAQTQLGDAQASLNSANRQADLNVAQADLSARQDLAQQQAEKTAYQAALKNLGLA